MEQKQRILILGATGRTGQHVLEAALTEDYEVNCLVRYPQKLERYQQDPRVKLIQGNPLNLAELTKAAEACHYLLSSLNISRKSDFPWAPLRTPKKYLSEVMQNIIQLQQRQAFEKVVICSAWGVNETLKDIPWWFRLLIQYSNIGPAYKDHERQERLLDLHYTGPWTVVRPVALINRTKQKAVSISYQNQPKPGLTISRREVGVFMLDALKRPELDFRKPVIWSPLFA